MKRRMKRLGAGAWSCRKAARKRGPSTLPLRGSGIPGNHGVPDLEFEGILECQAYGFNDLRTLLQNGHRTRKASQALIFCAAIFF
jgi:hypothetical protein